MCIGKRMREARETCGYTLDEVGKVAGVSNATIQRYEKGVITNIPSDKIEAIAKFLEVNPGYLMGWEDMEHFSKKNETISYPILGEIACGSPVLAHENISDYFAIDKSIKADFILIAKGDSMIDDCINEGDLCFIKEQNTAENGQIIAVLIEDEATLKRYYKQDENVILQPANKSYEPIILKSGNVRILGVLKAVVSVL